MISNYKINFSRFLVLLTILLNIIIYGQYGYFFTSINQTLVKVVLFSDYFLTFLLLLYSLDLVRKRKVKSIFGSIRSILPIIFIFIFIELFAIFLNKDVALNYGFSGISRFVSIMLGIITMIIKTCCIFYIAQDKTIKYVTDAYIIDGFLILIAGILKHGFFQSITSIFNMLSFSNIGVSLWEVHNASFSIGLLILYYVFNKEEKISKSRLLLLIFFFFIGQKRIGFLALLVALFFKFIIKKNTINKRFINMFSIVVMIFSLSYLNSLYNQNVFDFLNSHNINVMGRDILYPYFLKRTEFSINQLPWGIGITGKAFENASRNDFSYMTSTKGLHNDILKNYIELGCVGFLVWLYFISNYFPKKILKHDNNAVKIYLIMLVYMLITYMTDNTCFYMDVKLVLYLITFTQIWNGDVIHEK